MYNIIKPIQTRPYHPLNIKYETGEELFSGACDIRGVDRVVVLVSASMADSFGQLTIRIEPLLMTRCGSISALIIFSA
ncbi:hypothetical protein RB195_006829 [Necator americanus]|uniref:Uncharacterized protein n=1 Tax=Necator americanus TaxID=51031 RepID=A0ABR1BXB5_NECAM